MTNRDDYSLVGIRVCYFKNIGEYPDLFYTPIYGLWGVKFRWSGCQKQVDLGISWEALWEFFHIEKMRVWEIPVNPGYKKQFDMREKYWNRILIIRLENIEDFGYHHRFSA